MHLIKKGLMIAMGTAMAVALTACGNTKEPNQTGDERQELEQEPDQQVGGQTEPEDKEKPKKPDETGADKQAKDASDQDETEYFGTVKDMVGNEIEVDLAKNESFDNSGQDITAIEGEGSSVGAVGSISMAGDSSISFGDADEDMLVSEISPGDNQAEMELEYTGESKRFTIPAGVPIIDSGGNEVPMTDIKEGSILRITASKTGDEMVITTIQIVK